MVPQYFANGREFQVFLRAIDIALSVIKSNTDNFIPNLLNPLKCKARLLPLLSNYVGYDYNPRERVLTNRWITKLYPLLVRNRGNELGITLAVAMSICLTADPEQLNFENNFSMEYEDVVDNYGRTISVLKIYLYTTDYLPILKDMIEVVRPAGTKIEFIPATNITSNETIVLTDEYSIAKYDYITGKLLSINDIDIVVQNSWELLTDNSIKHYRWKDLENWQWGTTEDQYSHIKSVDTMTWGELEDTGEDAYGAMPGLAPYNIDNKNNEAATYWNTTNIWLTDGRFYDKYGNDLNRWVDPLTGKIMYGGNTGEGEAIWNNEIVKETRIYVQDSTGEHYTGMYFDVSNPAKVLNTYYKLLDDGIFSGYYLSVDDLIIYDSTNMNSSFKLIEETTPVDGIQTLVWKVYDVKGNTKYNWHVDKVTRKFIRDEDGKNLIFSQNKIPFSETTYLGKKAYIMKKTENEDGTYTIAATKYFVNKYGDIIDPAGNIILSKQDRYKVSDSNMIGFAEVHNKSERLSTYDGTNILQREWSFMKDNDIQDVWGKNEVNDFEEYDRVTDLRYKIDHYSFDIGYPVREYTGVELIKFLSNAELLELKAENKNIRIPLFTSDFDSENASGELKVKIDLPMNYSLGDIFKTLNIRFENKVPNDEINPYWDIYIDWTANNKNKSLFNLNDLENPIHFIKCGKIEPRTLHWTSNPIYITPKIYDGTTKVFIKEEDQ